MKRNESKLYAQAIKKLSAEELSVLIAPFAAVALVYKDMSIIEASGTGKGQSGVDAGKLNGLKKAIKEMEEKMKERMRIKWLGSDGTEYDTYREYLNGQWGVDLPYPPSPFE